MPVVARRASTPVGTARLDAVAFTPSFMALSFCGGASRFRLTAELYYRINYMSSITYITSIHTGWCDVRRQGPDASHPPPARPRRRAGPGGEGDHRAQAPGERSDRPPGSRRGGAEARW